MREIKFRAWDKAENTMNTNGIIGAGSSAEIINIDFNGQLHLSNYYGLDFASKNPAFDEREERFVLMQYTGLKDKNGKEIYEGDILSYGVYEGGGDLVGKDCRSVIGFEDGGFNERLVFEEKKEASIDNGCGEVVGNIYEHPHLLTTY